MIQSLCGGLGSVGAFPAPSPPPGGIRAVSGSTGSFTDSALSSNRRVAAMRSWKCSRMKAARCSASKSRPPAAASSARAISRPLA